MGERKKKTRKLRFKGLIVIVLAIYLIGTIVFSFLSKPLKNIQINGNNYLKDNYIIRYLDLENKSIFQISSRKLKNKLLELDLVSDAKIKKNYLGKLTIDITEDRVLFYNLNKNKIILSSGREVAYNENYLGVPVLINYVKDDVYEEFIKKLNKVDSETLSLVSEIEYSPSIVNEKIVDNKRFLFRMNDGNIVYIINTVNIEKFNDYAEIYEVIANKNGDVKGCLYLDSNSENNHFNKCDIASGDGNGE